jgi:hypothetical protein
MRLSAWLTQAPPAKQIVNLVQLYQCADRFAKKLAAISFQFLVFSTYTIPTKTASHVGKADG